MGIQEEIKEGREKGIEKKRERGNEKRNEGTMSLVQDFYLDILIHHGTNICGNYFRIEQKQNKNTKWYILYDTSYVKMHMWKNSKEIYQTVKYD